MRLAPRFLEPAAWLATWLLGLLGPSSAAASPQPAANLWNAYTAAAVATVRDDRDDDAAVFLRMALGVADQLGVDDARPTLARALLTVIETAPGQADLVRRIEADAESIKQSGVNESLLPFSDLLGRLASFYLTRHEGDDDQSRNPVDFDLARAESLLKLKAAIELQIQPNDNARIASTLKLEGWVLARELRYEQSIKLEEEAVELLTRQAERTAVLAERSKRFSVMPGMVPTGDPGAGGPIWGTEADSSDPDLMSPWSILGKDYMALGDRHRQEGQHAEALIAYLWAWHYLNQYLDAYDAVWQGHPGTARIVRALSNVYKALHNDAEVERLLWSYLRFADDEDRDDIRTAVSDLAALLRRSHRDREAEALQARFP